jgi:prepilin-type processing-associated H-X9-DG protein
VDRKHLGTSTIGPHPARSAPAVAPRDPPRSAVASRSAIGRPILNFWGWEARGNTLNIVAALAGQPNVYNSTNPWGTPFSFHPGGLHVAFGDGAVQFINETIASNVWQALARKADGTAMKYQP